jgi:hypothetical protein
MGGCYHIPGVTCPNCAPYMPTFMPIQPQCSHCHCIDLPADEPEANPDPNGPSLAGWKWLARRYLRNKPHARCCKCGDERAVQP